MVGRGSILSAVGGIGALVMAVAPLTARQNVARLEKVKDNLYVIKEGGGNTAAFITADGVVVVDTKLAGWGQAILDQIKTVTPKPVTMIINTHTHNDHTGSNGRCGMDGNSTRIASPGRTSPSATTMFIIPALRTNLPSTSLSSVGAIKPCWNLSI